MWSGTEPPGRCPRHHRQTRLLCRPPPQTPTWPLPGLTRDLPTFVLGSLKYSREHGSTLWPPLCHSRLLPPGAVTVATPVRASGACSYRRCARQQYTCASAFLSGGVQRGLLLSPTVSAGALHAGAHGAAQASGLLLSARVCHVSLVPPPSGVSSFCLSRSASCEHPVRSPPSLLRNQRAAAPSARQGPSPRFSPLSHGPADPCPRSRGVAVSSTVT